MRLIEQQRNGLTIREELVKTAIDSFVSWRQDRIAVDGVPLDVYKENFEKPFIKATEKYYMRESEMFLAERSVPNYLEKAEQRLCEEEDRVKRYLHAGTHERLVQTCERVLIRDHLVKFCDKCRDLLHDGKDESLRCMYALLIRIPEGLQSLKERFEECVTQAGLLALPKLIDNGAAVDPMAHVEVLFEVHQKHRDIVIRAFKGDAAFTASLDRVCRELWLTFQDRLNYDNDEHLERMYAVLAPISEGLEPLRQKFEERVKTTGLAAVSRLVDIEGARGDTVDPQTYVHTLYEVHRQSRETIDKSFRGDTSFVKSLDKMCREFVNQNAVTGTSSSKSPELLAKHTDALLRKNSKLVDEGDLEGALNQVVRISAPGLNIVLNNLTFQIAVFRYIDDKDVFQTYYITKLSKRLIHGVSVSDRARRARRA